MKCPSVESFADFLSGELHEDELARFKEHLAVCPSCQQRMAGEERLSALLRNHLPLKAPMDFRDRVLAKLALSKARIPIPDWLFAVAFGLLVAFGGLTVGRFGGAILQNLTGKVSDLPFDTKILGEFDKIGFFQHGDWIAQLSGGGNLILVNFALAGIILCWGLWQMVKALRR